MDKKSEPQEFQTDRHGDRTWRKRDTRMCGAFKISSSASLHVLGKSKALASKGTKTLVVQYALALMEAVTAAAPL